MIVLLDTPMRARRFGFFDLFYEDDMLTRFTVFSLALALTTPFVMAQDEVKDAEETAPEAQAAEGDATTLHSPPAFTFDPDGCRVEVSKKGRSFTSAFADAMTDAMGVELSWPENAETALAALPPGHAFTVPDVLFAKIADEDREGWAARFAGVRT